MEEKRRAQRVNWFVEAQVFCVDYDLHWNVRLTDISEGGCFVDTIVPLEPGAKVRVKVNDGQSKLDIPGKILYGSAGIGSAIEFDPMEAGLHGHLLKIIESRSG
jgi:PilZ domain-containing protein